MAAYPEATPLRWVKSSHSFSNGQCVEVASWRKSSRSNFNGQCLEVAHLPGGTICVRDSKDPSGPVLQFTPGQWRAFLGGARDGN